MDEPKEMLEELREDCIMQAKQEANEMSQQIDQKMEQEIQEQQPVTVTPVSSKVIILDAGHRSTGRTEPKVQMEQQKRKQT